eukprot:3713551-Pleurochrysis_carterae.AAC.1
MSEKLAHVVRRVSELAGTLLDVKIAMTHATGQLSPTVAAIRDVLSELEAREQKSAFDTSNRGRAFLAQQEAAALKTTDKARDKARDKPHKRSDPKRAERPNTFDKEWNARFGNCRHCGGKHWHRDCPRRPKKPDPKGPKAGDGGRVLTAADDAGDVENGSALFCQPGGATLSFSAATEGRALCTHDVEL